MVPTGIRHLRVQPSGITFHSYLCWSDTHVWTAKCIQIYSLAGSVLYFRCAQLHVEYCISHHVHPQLYTAYFTPTRARQSILLSEPVGEITCGTSSLLGKPKHQNSKYYLLEYIKGLLQVSQILFTKHPISHQNWLLSAKRSPSLSLENDLLENDTPPVQLIQTTLRTGDPTTTPKISGFPPLTSSR